MLSLIGLVGSLCLALSALPQVILSIKNRHSDGIARGMIWLWFIGVFCMLIYTTQYKDTMLLVNYTANLLFVGVILYFSYFPKRTV